jgi:putative aldouronate transport system permease protein
MMIEKLTPSRVVFNVFNYIFMALICVICLAPIWHVLMASISDPRMLMQTKGILWLPTGNPTFDGYNIVFKNQSIITGYINTLIYVAAFTLLGIVLIIIAGFVLSRKTKLRGPLMIMLLFTMMFSGGLIPSYIINMNIGLIENRWAVIIPGCINAFYIIIMKNAFDQLPESFEESAKLDGASPFRILLQILLPLVKATVAVIAMFLIVQKWNSWFGESIYLPKSREKWPLQLFMREILVQNDSNMITEAEAKGMASLVKNLVKHCVTIVGTLPILMVYPFAQKYFVQGVTLGGVKG